MLSGIATATGGAYYQVDQAEELAQVFGVIGEEIGRGCPPLAPTGVTALFDRSGDAEVRWDPPRQSDTPVTGYQIYVFEKDNTEPEATYALVAAEGHALPTVVTVPGLPQTKHYEFAVSAVNDAGESITSARSESNNPARGEADRLLALPLDEFLEVWASEPEPFIWEFNGCSGPTSGGVEETFSDPCKRHDFGYQNYGKGLRLSRTVDARDLIDDVLASDAFQKCDAMGDPLLTTNTLGWQVLLPPVFAAGSLIRCSRAADLMHWAVQNAGYEAFFGYPECPDAFPRQRVVEYRTYACYNAFFEGTGLPEEEWWRNEVTPIQSP